MNHSINITRIKAVNNAFGKLKDKVVFVGGATISLYPDRSFFETRVTDDVDVIVEIINYQGRVELEEKLRSLGFAHDIESSVVCRYKIEGIIVDIMPTVDPSIGFNNKWYPEGFQKAIDYSIDGENVVKILSAPYFIATKFEAFNGRGQGSSLFYNIPYEPSLYRIVDEATPYPLGRSIVETSRIPILIRAM